MSIAAQPRECVSLSSAPKSSCNCIYMSSAGKLPRKYDWTGSPVSRGFAPQMRTKVLEPLATLVAVAALQWNNPFPRQRSISRVLRLQQSTLDLMCARSPSRSQCYPQMRRLRGSLRYDLKKLRRYQGKLGPAATLRTCYEESGADYVRQRELASLGIACTVIAPSLIPTKLDVQRKHDEYDAEHWRASFAPASGHTVRAPTAAE